jgi:two-component system chemotaxis response regulator CheB
MAGHPIIVLGASAGGLASLKEILEGLTADLEASSLFVVVHIPARPPVDFVRGLRAVTQLEVDWARDRESIRPRRVYVAPPNRQLVAKRDQVRVGFSPRENRFRPAIDVLFRSAAVAHGTGVIGVVLSGYLEDGAAGLSMIKRCGGIAVVLEPATAEAPSMPEAAIARTPGVDRVLPAGEIAAELRRLATQEPGPQPVIPQDILAEAAAAERMMTETSETPRFGSQTDMVCPDCGGVLREIEGGPWRRFRCRLGHTFTTARLLEAMDDEVERALWTAVRTLQERADLLAKLASTSGRAAEDFQVRARELVHQGQLLEGMLADLIAARDGKEASDAVPRAPPPHQA